MRFMIIVRATALSESETKPDDIDPKVMAAMADYHQQLAEAGGCGADNTGDRVGHGGNDAEGEAHRAGG